MLTKSKSSEKNSQLNPNSDSPPHPESLYGCLKYCKTKPDDAVYIGNSKEDGTYAKAASVDFIFLERKEHSFTGKHIATIHSLMELI